MNGQPVGETVESIAREAASGWPESRKLAAMQLHAEDLERRLNEAVHTLNVMGCENIVAERDQLRADLAAAREENAEYVRRIGANETAQLLIQAVEAQCKATLEAQAILRSVEEWWLRDGMKHSLGAPACIFAVREFLADKATFQK